MLNTNMVVSNDYSYLQIATITELYWSTMETILGFLYGMHIYKTHTSPYYTIPIYNLFSDRSCFSI